MQMQRVGEIHAITRRRQSALDYLDLLNRYRVQPDQAVEGVTYLGSVKAEIAAQNPLGLKHHAEWHEHFFLREYASCRSDMLAPVVDEEPKQDVGINGAGHSTSA